MAKIESKPKSIKDTGLQEPDMTLLNIFPQHQPLEDVIDRILPMMGDHLQCDRIFLYVRSPRYQIGRVPFCWRRHESIPEVYDPDWKREPSSLPQNDPLFKAALMAHPSIFVDDVEAASPDVLNQEFEQESFGHRALIHAHLCNEQKLWGILQPCVFDNPRHWDQGDRQLIEQAVSWLTPLTMEYVNRNFDPHLAGSTCANLNGAVEN